MYHLLSTIVYLSLPSEDNQLELNQIDFLKNRYKDIVIFQRMNILVGTIP